MDYVAQGLGLLRTAAWECFDIFTSVVNRITPRGVSLFVGLILMYIIFRYLIAPVLR